MMDTSENSQNLAEDYIQGARQFIWAADKIISNTDRQSSDWFFRMENPVTFILCHAAELLLKAGLSKKSLLDRVIKHKHDLVQLTEISRSNNIPLNDNFCEFILIMNDNFKSHDYRYPRYFRGFPDGSNKEHTPAEKKSAGLIIRSTIDPSVFLGVLEDQFRVSCDWVSPSTPSEKAC